MVKSPDIVVIGGGIIGVSIAYELSKRSLDVLVLERNLLASCATYASAGMLAPASDSLCAGPVVNLGFESFAMWPHFLQEVESASGFSMDCRRQGILRVAGTEDEEHLLKQQSAWASERGLDLPWLNPKEAIGLEPELCPKIRGATFSAAEDNVTPTLVVEALRRAAAENGAEFRENTPVSTLSQRKGQVSGVITPKEEIFADKVVLSVGAWGCEVGTWLGMDVPVRPVRGEIAILNELSEPLRHTVMRGNSCYAVPKSDGSTLIGTTRKHGCGYSQKTTVAGMASFFGSVTELLPSVGKASVNHTRAGLRPWCGDDLPVIGPAPETDNVIFATGHYASGILLAPITARIVADVITKGTKDLGPLAATRFAKGAP